MVNKTIKKPVKTLKKEEEVKLETEIKTNEPEKIVTDEEIEKEIKKVEKVIEEEHIIGKVKSPIFQKSSFIKTKNVNSPVMLHELPEDLRKYLINMGFGTNVYEKGEEWLLKHGADMEKIRELKKFISEHYM